MKISLRQARLDARLSLEDAARQMFLSSKQLHRYETGRPVLNADIVCRAARVYHNHALIPQFCKAHCEIGRRYGYIPLDNVDLTPLGILTKYRQEAREVDALLERLIDLALNKNGEAVSFSPAEMGDLKRGVLELLDVEHVILTLKFALARHVDIEALVGEHNTKCFDRGYVTVAT